MKGAQQYIVKRVEYFGKVNSQSDPFKQYVVFKSKNRKWYCSCTAGMMGGNCKHKQIMAEKVGEGDRCFNCGTTSWAAGGLEKNHVEMRGVRPDLTSDPENIMLLDRKCHERFHSDQEFKENLQRLWQRMKKKI